MIKTYKSVAITCLLLSLSACKTTSNTQIAHEFSPGQLIIGEPLPVSFENEVRLARITDILLNKELKPAHRAQALFRRGVLFDGFGLSNMAYGDFNRALHINPKMADAYNFIGIHLTMAGQFDKAYEAFDATLELAPEHQYVYLNRGIALYYGGKDKLAVQDFKQFHQLDPKDPYRVLWRYISEQKIDKHQAILDLNTNLAAIDDGVWAKQIGLLFSMKISQAQFIDGLSVGIANSKEMAKRLCEAYFYLGVYARIYDKPERAINFFKLTLATNVYEYVEHRFARRELLESRLDLHKKKIAQQALVTKQ